MKYIKLFEELYENSIDLIKLHKEIKSKKEFSDVTDIKKQNYINDSDGFDFLHDGNKYQVYYDTKDKELCIVNLEDDENDNPDGYIAKSNDEFFNYF